jgi:hypothetical protein
VCNECASLFKNSFYCRTERREDEDLSTDPPPPLPEEEPDGGKEGPLKGLSHENFMPYFLYHKNKLNKLTVFFKQS